MNSHYTADFRERFWSRVDRSDAEGCWLWRGYTLPNGYGRVRFAGRLNYAHRVSYELSNGTIPDGALVLHSCDRPGCVNPAHIRAGSPKENMADMDARGRRRSPGQGATRFLRSHARRPKLDDHARFWAKVAIDHTPGACWLWTAGTQGGGYGAFVIGGLTRKAHRVSYELHKGPLPPGAHVLHACDRPACVNPDHLRAGTQQENTADMDARGRRGVVDSRGVKNGRVKLTESDVLAIRARAARGGRQVDLAREYKVSEASVSLIVSRKNWRHI